MKQQYYWGYVAIALSVVITLGLWLGSMWYYDDWYEDPFKYVAKVGSMPATLFMCWALVLATRFRPVNALFGGLDKAYQAHQLVGKAAFGLIFLHPVFLAMHLLPDWPAFGRFLWFSADWVRNTGLVALFALVALVVISIWQPLKYQWWKQTHNLFGLLLVLVVYHGIKGHGEIMRYPLLRAWFAVWVAAGLGSYFYTRVLYRFFGPLYRYRVAEVRQLDDIAEVYLELAGPRRMPQRAGQFLYISFDAPAVSQELHPYTVSSAPEADRLRLSVKALGDWSAKLPDLKPGDWARVWGPYGEFGNHLWQQPTRDAVLIAGGIGITPFLSMLASAAFMQRRQGKTYLVYSVEKADEALYHEEIEALDLDGKAIIHVPHRSDDEGLLDAEMLQAKVGELTAKCFLICGPAPLMESVEKELLAAEVPLERIFKEDFNLV